MVPVGVAQVGWVRVTEGTLGKLGTALMVNEVCGETHVAPVGRTVKLWLPGEIFVKEFET